MINADAREALAYVKRIGKVVVWGLHSQWHSHRFIHQGFVETFRHLGIPVVWTNFNADPGIIGERDFVITSNATGRGTRGDPLAPLRPGAYYCFHGFEGIPYEIDRARYMRLEVFTRKALSASESWDPVTFFDAPTKTLYQPWGTNLVEESFHGPTVSLSPFVFWVGAIWDNALGQGNIKEVSELRRVLQARSLRFVHLKFVPNWVNVQSVRHSRIAPAIAGGWQVEWDYLPCRMFKNISYGQLGISNVGKFRDLFVNCTVQGDTVAELIDNALSLPTRDVLAMTA